MKMVVVYNEHENFAYNWMVDSKMKLIIRKLECGHWLIVRILTDIFDESFIYFHPIAHVDTFSDILLLINGEATLEYV